MAFDTSGARVDLKTSHASLSRTLPLSLRPREERAIPDSDALRWLLESTDAPAPRELALSSTAADGSPLDRLEHVPLAPAPCPSGSASGAHCSTSTFIRATTDWLDRSHPRALEPSLIADVGGRLVVSAQGQDIGSIAVGGPRHTRLGPLERYRGRLRVRVLRAARGAGVSVGSDVAGGLDVVRRELA